MENIFLVLIIPLALILWFWAINDLTRSRFKEPNRQTLFLLIVLLSPILGALIYLALRRQLITEEPRRFKPKFSRPQN